MLDKMLFEKEEQTKAESVLSEYQVIQSKWGILLSNSEVRTLWNRKIAPLMELPNKEKAAC